MKKKLIIRCLILIMLIGVIYEISTIVISFNENNTILEDIEMTNKFNNKKQIISIKVENDNDYEYHEYEDRTKWPDKTKYTYAGSLCTDWGGNNINESIIKFDEVNYKATITTKKTAYCTLYFTKGKPALTVLKDKGGSKFNSLNAVFGLYRFNGTQTDVTNHILNNFVCFGTTDLTTCTGSDKQYYMYRIIGITDNTTTNTTLGLKENQLKIIRAYPSNQSQVWHSSETVNAQWDSVDGKSDADVQKYLNGSFLTTEKVKWKNDYWEGIITSPYWYIGDNINQNDTSETTTKSNRVHSVGLMYKSDYINAGPYAAYNFSNWLFLQNGMNDSKQFGLTSSEWTMSRGDIYGGGQLRVWNLSGNGAFISSNPTNESVVRPIFYLKSNVTLAGEGTEASPFIITSKN